MLKYFEITCDDQTFNLVFDDTIPIPTGKYRSSFIYFATQNSKIIKNIFGDQLSFGNRARILKYCWLNISDEFKNNFDV